MSSNFNNELLPLRFFKAYKNALRKDSRTSIENYKNNKSWTPVAIDAAVAAIKSFRGQKLKLAPDPLLNTQKEYYRVDVIGYEGKGEDWRLRIALEHENDRRIWGQELCKLSHIIADLRILVAYHDYRKGTVEDALKEKLKRLSSVGDRCRITGLTNSQWLFIFGPSGVKNYSNQFMAFTTDEDAKVVELLDEDDLLIPSDFPEN